MEVRWRIELFGGLRAERGSAAGCAGAPVLNHFRTQKTGVLLAYLAYYRQRAHAREELIELLWPGCEPHLGRNNLSKELSWLRDQLEPPDVPAGAILVTDRLSVGLNPAALSTDVATFETALQLAERAGDSTDRAQSLIHAAEAYHGPLLAGYYEDWVLQERAWLAERHFQALGQLVALLEQAGDLHRALDYARQGVSADPLREEAHRELMRLLVAMGQPAAALRQYRELERLLQQELGTRPESATRSLARNLERRAVSRPPPDSPVSPPLEIAHVLAMELMGCSQMPSEAQIELLGKLQQLVRGTPEFRRAEGCGELLRLPSGEGMALVFFRDPAAPVRCGMEIARALRSASPLRLRIGVHSGPVYRVEDINAHASVSGSGIQLARAVMACGDAGHILLSRAVVELLGQLGEWLPRSDPHGAPVPDDVGAQAPTLRDLGECEVRPGAPLHLFNLYRDDLGDPALPASLRPDPRAAREPTPRLPPLAAEGAPAVAESGEPRAESDSQGSEHGQLRVALLYKRHAQPDEQVLQLLETQLTAQGYQVFVDRHLAIGVEWATEIERQVRTADAVIPLLSAASAQSEMLAYEVQIAHEAAQQNGGKPRRLPVRVRYTGPLPEPLAGMLDPLEYTTWEGPQDDERLLLELLNALRHPTDPGPVILQGRLEPVGGAVPLDSAFYVVRPTDGEFRAAIARQDSIVLIKGARQMGKTSLLARGLHQAREAGARVVLMDFQKLDAAHLASVETLFLTLAQWMALQLDLEVLPHEVWNTGCGPSLNFELYIRRHVLGQQRSIVWGLDEVDRLFTCDFGSDVFALFRAWHNERALDPAGPWAGLLMAITYATEAHLFITDMNRSPFNVGTRLTLEDFTFDQVADLNRRYGSPLKDDTEIARFYRLVSGQPYLVRRGLHELAVHGMGIAALEAQADHETGVFGEHLRRLLVSLVQDSDLCEVVRGVLQGKPCPTAESFYRLRSAGVLSGEAAPEARPRCRLYALYLERHLR
jgi:DNA-binding SARP family transcriptional activator